LYADDIIIIAPSVVALEKLLLTVEHELLELLDMEINAKKSMCIRIGPRFSVPCASIFTIDGRVQQWLDSICYLGVTIISATSFTMFFYGSEAVIYIGFSLQQPLRQNRQNGFRRSYSWTALSSLPHFAGDTRI
jgi:hypothetical protein